MVLRIMIFGSGLIQLTCPQYKVGKKIVLKILNIDTYTTTRKSVSDVDIFLGKEILFL